MTTTTKYDRNGKSKAAEADTNRHRMVHLKLEANLPKQNTPSFSRLLTDVYFADNLIHRINDDNI